MNGVQDKFIVRTFAIGLVAVFIIMAAALFGAIFYFGDGEAYKIIGDMTTPFLALCGAITAAFLGQHAANIMSGDSAAKTSARAFDAQESLYNRRQSLLRALDMLPVTPNRQGPLSTRLHAQERAGTHSPDASRDETDDGGEAHGH